MYNRVVILGISEKIVRWIFIQKYNVGNVQLVSKQLATVPEINVQTMSRNSPLCCGKASVNYTAYNQLSFANLAVDTGKVMQNVSDAEVQQHVENQ